ncbi:MAG TPA: hypothetical protein VIL48_16155 [Acidimicrobiales bacterium]
MGGAGRRDGHGHVPSLAPPLGEAGRPVPHAGRRPRGRRRHHGRRRRHHQRDAWRAGYADRASLLAELDRHEGQLYRIDVHHAGADPRVALRAAADLSPDDDERIAARLARLDRASGRGPWTRQVLALVAARPAVRAADLAASLGRDTPSFKRDVRKLKELGLTESLEVGYRLSPRGEAVLARLGARPD